jgi:hypothetical protein
LVISLKIEKPLSHCGQEASAGKDYSGQLLFFFREFVGKSKLVMEEKIKLQGLVRLVLVTPCFFCHVK